MRKKKIFLSICLLLSVSIAHSQDALRVHGSDGLPVASPLLDGIQRITFSGGNMNIKTSDGNVAAYAIKSVGKITFGDAIKTGIDDLFMENAVDVSVYVSPSGEIVVESASLVQKQTLYNIDGKMCRFVKQARMNVSDLSEGVYILLVETAEGTIAKKIIK